MSAKRLCITGAPGAGKTYLASAAAGRLGVSARHTDEFSHANWHKQSVLCAGLFDEPGPWVVEGTTVARGLRKWLAMHPEGKPCDAVVHMPDPREPEECERRRRMGKAVCTVMAEIAPELRRRGVEVHVR